MKKVLALNKFMQNYPFYSPYSFLLIGVGQLVYFKKVEIITAPLNSTYIGSLS